VVGIIKRTR